MQLCRSLSISLLFSPSIYLSPSIRCYILSPSSPPPKIGLFLYMLPIFNCNHYVVLSDWRSQSWSIGNWTLLNNEFYWRQAQDGAVPNLFVISCLSVLALPCSSYFLALLFLRLLGRGIVLFDQYFIKVKETYIRQLKSSGLEHS